MQIRKQIQFPSNFPKSNHIIIDTDVGGDDAHAIITAFYLAKKYNKKIVGIFCIQGNTTVQNVIKNVVICKGIMAQSNPQYKTKFPKIIKGSSQSLMGDKIASKGDNYFHQDGLCSNQQKYLKIVNQFINVEEQINSIINEQKSAAQIYNDLSKQYVNDISILAIGPLTNVALAYLYDNQIVNRISSISIMGGAYSGVGMNDCFCTEFNYHMDPYAAKIVIQVYKNIVSIGIQYAFSYKTENINEIFKNKDTHKGRFIQQIYEPIMKIMPPVLCDLQAAFPLFCPQQSQIKCYQLAGQVQTLGLRTRGLFMPRAAKQGDKKIYSITKINNKFMQKIVQESYYY